jgi:F0F1-type ATP synthase alpha subunit
MKKVAGKLRLDMAQYRELAAFAQFGSDLDAATKQQLERGKRTSEILKQNVLMPLPVTHQVAVLYAVTQGLLDEIKVEEVQKWEKDFLHALTTQHSKFLQNLEKTAELSPEIEKELKEIISNFNALRTKK